MTAKRVDSNQRQMTKAARDMGVSVWITSALGHGAPDMVLGIPTQRGGYLNLMVEIKDGSKPPSQRKLTPDEEKFHDEWKGQICVIGNLDDLVELINRARM